MAGDGAGDRAASDKHLLAKRWIHMFEEDTADGAVYRPDDGKIPLSRRPREQLQFGADGHATLYTAGADDRLGGSPVRWRDAGDPHTSRDLGAEVHIVDRSPDRLVVRLSGRQG